MTLCTINYLQILFSLIFCLHCTMYMYIPVLKEGTLKHVEKVLLTKTSRQTCSLLFSDIPTVDDKESHTNIYRFIDHCKNEYLMFLGM